MNSPVEPKTCSRCGAPLTPGALQGLCPRCLLALNLGTQTEMTADGPGSQGTKAVSAPEPPTLEEIARHFPGLEILELLGHGGMGAVYKVRQKQLDRIVALKILPPRSGDDSAFAERFTREAKALAKLLHPNIVTLFEFGQADGIYYLLMEYVDGVNLGQLLRASRVSPREALAIVPQICDALQYAHDHGIIHRDIKPENILLDRLGRVKVADFGLAKIVEGRAGSPLPAGTDEGAQGTARPTSELTEAGKIMGTPKYMSPEQIEAPGEVDHRADIYALGVVFYQMLTGELPGKPLEPPSRKVQIDVRLDEVVLRALERKPERRYQQVSEVKTDVQKIASGTPPPGQTFGQPVEARRLKKINCVPALSLYCLTDTLIVAANWREFTGHTDYALAPYAIGSWIVGCVFWSILHYSCWKALPEKYRATTPGRALGFLFIPLFNFYWFFVSFPKLATGFNALKRDRPELPIRNLKGVGIAYAITGVLVSTVALNHPGWACLIFVTDLILTFVFYLGIVANANLVIEASQPARAPAAATPRRTPMSELPRSGGRAWKIAAAVIAALVALNCVIAFLAFRPKGIAPPPGLVAWWPLDGNAADVAGGHNGTLEGSYHFGPAEVGQGLFLEGERSGISVPDSPNLNFGPDQDFSIEAWIQPLHSDTTSGVMDIVDKRIAPDIVRSHGYTMAVMNGKLSFQISDSLDAPMLSWEQNGPDLRDGLWHHVAATVERASVEGVKLYVDGKVIATFDPTPARGDLGTEHPLLIGMHQSYPWYRGNYRGGLDEVSLYKRALSPAEVLAIYSAGQNGKRKPGPALSKSPLVSGGSLKLRPTNSADRFLASPPASGSTGAQVAFRWVAASGDTNSPADWLPYLRARSSKEELRVLREVVLDSDAVESAGFTQYQPDQKELAVFLTPQGGRKFAEATAKNVGRQLAIVWNDRVVSAPVIRSPITGRGVNITGLLNDAEAKQLLDLLNHRAPKVASPP